MTRTLSNEAAGYTPDLISLTVFKGVGHCISIILFPVTYKQGSVGAQAHAAGIRDQRIYRDLKSGRQLYFIEVILLEQLIIGIIGCGNG
jgi:hypothetical protein